MKALERPSTTQLLRYFLYLGSLGFGGPVALVGYMQRDLVERRAWFTKDEYTKSLALSQLAPGPLAAQLAICLGYVHSRIQGAILVALAFILPSFVMTVVISWFYVRFGGLSWMQAAFYGVGATVIAIITLAAYKLAKLTMAKDRLQWAIFAVMGVVTAWTESEILWLFILCGVVAMVAQAPPAFLRRATPTCLAVAVTPEILGQVLWFFTKAGAFVFGSGLAIVPFLYGGVVQQHGWLRVHELKREVVTMGSPVSPRMLIVFGITLIVGTTASARAAAPDWRAVEQALGKSGQLQAGDVFRVGMPRTDLAVTVRGIAVKAGFALGSYAAFKQVGDQAMVMGDLVLLDQEVPAVMSGLLNGGLEVTAVHNHLNEMSPHVMYVHYAGHGDAVQLARALGQALSASGTPLVTAAPAPAAATGPTLGTKQIEQALGRSGRDIGGGVFQVTVPRAESITEMGRPLLPAMGVATVLNFQPLADGRAAITGDFVLVDKEVNAVARVLRQQGIDVTALHNHGLMDTPRLFYMHFWATDDAVKLARGLKAALDQTNSQK